jgi:hypothetical protein
MNRRLWKQSALLVGVMAVAVAGWPRTSIGADSKVMGSSSCRRTGSNVLGLEYTSNGVRNISGTSIVLMCNLPRDNTGNTNGLSDLEVVVINSLNGAASCSAVAIDRNGNPMKVVSKSSSGAGSAVIDFGATLNVSASKGSYAVFCNVTDQSLLTSVFVNEF